MGRRYYYWGGDASEVMWVYSDSIPKGEYWSIKTGQLDVQDSIYREGDLKSPRSDHPPLRFRLMVPPGL